MPFKVGDKVRRLTPHNNPYIPVGTECTVSETNYGGTWLSIKEYPIYHCGFDAEKFELVKEPEVKFEVGKKYKGMGNVIRKCVYVNETHWLGELVNKVAVDKVYLMSIELSKKFWTEYVPEPPKPVKKEGWTVLYTNSFNDVLTGCGLTNRLFRTKEEAEEFLRTYLNPRTRCVAHLEWEEPGKPEDDEI